ncbi:MAG: hypothetical protein J6P57_07080 [Lachnospiraceae bacterium]|nr:hypothetical protein [Lachnospiraceae bacterium]
MCNEDNDESWYEISPWTLNNEWINWTPSVSGNYILVCYARIAGNTSEYDGYGNIIDEVPYGFVNAY